VKERSIAPQRDSLGAALARGTALVPRGGARRGLLDLAVAVVLGLLRFVGWFVAGRSTPAVEGARRRMSFSAVLRVGIVLLIVLVAYAGFANPLLTSSLLGVVVLVAMYGFVARSYARDRMFVAATRELDGTIPLDAASVSAPSLMAARPLQQLALGADRIRRGDAHGARAAVREVDEDHLEPDERRMLLAIRALAASATQDHKLAGLLAIGAFPTGADPIDERIGRLCFENAFHDGTRLHAMLEAWRKAGIEPTHVGPLADIQRLAMLKLNRLDPAALPAPERTYAAQYARALGDLELERTLLEAAAASMNEGHATADGGARYR
jgi:hypothetical protein